MSKSLHEPSFLSVKGFLKISDVTDSTDIKVLRDINNAIHYENISVAMVNALSNQKRGSIYKMSFGNGGTTVDPTGLISYLTPNTVGVNTGLYNKTYEKVVDQNAVDNLDPIRNKMEIRHISGATYSDIIITCFLDYGEPAGQEAFDNSIDMQGDYVFDELGLRSFDPVGEGKLLTHVIFHPVQKSLNRLIQIDYTIRIQSLTGFSEV